MAVIWKQLKMLPSSLKQTKMFFGHKGNAKDECNIKWQIEYVKPLLEYFCLSEERVVQWVKFLHEYKKTIGCLNMLRDPILLQCSWRVLGWNYNNKGKWGCLPNSYPTLVMGQLNSRWKVKRDKRFLLSLR